VSLSEKIDTTSAAGRMIFRMLAVLSEFERDLVSERTTAALRHKRSKGERIGAMPFGYGLAEDGVTLIEDAAELQVLQTIRALRDAGTSYHAIAAELNATGTTSKSGGRWFASAVRSVLQTTERAAA
jgi:site-specific DNA recombinase